MKVVLEEGQKLMLRFDKGEDVIALLKKLAIDQDIRSATFYGLGAVSEIVISWFNPDDKSYHDHSLTKKLEIVSLIGNITRFDGQPVIHAHGSFSDVELHGRSGHIKKLIVSATCEVFLEKFAGQIDREFNPDFGLSLMK